MQASLVMFKADGERRDFPIEKPVITIGRKHTCDLRIPLGIVSREHCKVEVKDDQLLVRDLGSSNGTYHNSERVQEASLEAGDTLVIGPVHFTVVVDGEPAEIAEPVKTVLPEGAEEVESGAPVMAVPADEDEDESEAPSDVGLEDLTEALGGSSESESEEEAPVETEPKRGVELDEPEDAAAVLDEQIEEDVVDPTVDLDLADEEDPIAALEALAALDSGDEGEDEDEEDDANDALSFLQEEQEEHEEKHG